MIARVLVQKDNATGEKHITFTTGPLTSRDEMLVRFPGWEDSTLVEGRVLILSMDDSDAHVDALMEAELHTPHEPHEEEDSVSRAVRRLLEGDNAPVQ